MAQVAPSETVRFTPAQRDALIDLAARLQAEQAASVGMDELAQAAREAGVDPRFLGEAALRLDAAPAPVVEPGPREALQSLAALALFDALFFGVVTRHWFFPVAPGACLPLMAASAFVFAWTFGRRWELRWVAPLVPIAVWAALGVAAAVTVRFHGSYRAPEMLYTATRFGLFQVLGAAVAAVLASSRQSPQDR